MARRRFIVTGNLGVQDPETSEVARAGDVVTLEEKDEHTQGLVDAGLLELESEHDADAAAATMACPLCEEQGVKKVPEFGDWTDLAAHYGKAHPGFVVPSWKGGNA